MDPILRPVEHLQVDLLKREVSVLDVFQTDAPLAARVTIITRVTVAAIARRRGGAHFGLGGAGSPGPGGDRAAAT